MRRIEQHRRFRWICWTVTTCIALGWPAACCWGQRTVVQDAGAGKKLELVYDASGNVTETKTVSAAGKLLEKVQYIRHPGFYAPQQISTGYWPDGKSVRTMSEMNYDQNTNFTREIIQVFDKSGKQIKGIRLTHNPFTGIYACYQWNVARQAYRPAKCPSGEESSEAPAETKELTYAEVMQRLAFARQARVEEQKVERMAPETRVIPPITTAMKEVDVILPAALRPGERVSGSIVLDPASYQAVPGIQIVPIRLPFESQGAAASLRGWTFEAAGSGRQLASGPVTFTVPAGKSGFNITLREVGNPSKSVSRQVQIATVQGKSQAQQPRNFEAAALCLKGSLCAVRGPFSGDSAKTIAAFASRPAPIMAETGDSAFIGIPDKVQPGPAHLIVADGLRVAALPVDVAEISFRPPLRVLKKGESMIVYTKLSGPEELARSNWKAGIFPASVSVAKARSLVPAFELPRESKEGVLLLVIRNATPGPISFRGSKNQTFAFRLTPESFDRGEFRYKFVADALQSGRFKLQEFILPFLAPVRGQQFSLRPGTAK